MTDQPLFHAPPPQNVEGAVIWVPEQAGEKAIVEYRGASLWATVPPGLTLALQDVVSLTWVGPPDGGRTLRVVQVVAHAPTLPTDPPAEGA